VSNHDWCTCGKIYGAIINCVVKCVGKIDHNITISIHVHLDLASIKTMHEIDNKLLMPGYYSDNMLLRPGHQQLQMFSFKRHLTLT